jgi:hypothetical protein
MKPIPDKAEVVLEYPDKFYSGTFERSSHYEAHFDEGGIALALSRGGSDSERRSVRLHVHYGLFAEVLEELAKTVAAIPPADDSHRDTLARAAAALATALRPAEQVAPAAGQNQADDDMADMAADEEVTLLHILE